MLLDDLLTTRGEGGQQQAARTRYSSVERNAVHLLY